MRPVGDGRYKVMVELTELAHKNSEGVWGPSDWTEAARCEAIAASCSGRILNIGQVCTALLVS